MATCLESGCAVAARAQGYCKRHYYTRRRHGLLFRVAASNHDSCIVAECGRQASKKGLCEGHYKRKWRTGKIEGHGKAMRGDGAKWLRDNVGHSGGDCLMWPFPRSGGGYGVVCIEGYEAPASRHMAILKFGQIPNDIHVCHTCDNPGCVNPNHLFVGTALDNHRDCVAKGRHVAPPRRAGEQNGEAKITNEQAAWARATLTAGRMTGREVAKHLGISETQVSRIKHNKSWLVVA